MDLKESDKLNTHNPIGRLSHRYLKWTAYGLVILLTTILQSMPHLFPSFGGSKPLLIIPVVVCIAMFEGPNGGAAAGVAGGFLWDLFSDRLLGFNSLFLMAICCACGLLTRLLIRNNLLSSLLLALAALIIQGVVDWFFNYVMSSQSEALVALLHLTLPNIVYSLVLTPLLYGGIYLVAKILRNRE